MTSVAPDQSIVVTRNPLYDHAGELIARGSLGVVVLAKTTQSAEDAYCEVELLGDTGRQRRIFSAGLSDLEVLSDPRGRLQHQPETQAVR